MSIVECYAAKDTLVGSGKAAQRTDHVLIPLGGATATCFGMSMSHVVNQPFFSNGASISDCYRGVEVFVVAVVGTSWAWW